VNDPQPNRLRYALTTIGIIVAALLGLMGFFALIWT